MKAKFNKIDFDERISEKEKLIIYSVERLRLMLEVPNYMLCDDGSFDKHQIEGLKDQAMFDFYDSLKEFIHIEFVKGRFNGRALLLKISLPYISSNVMKRINNDNKRLKTENFYANDINNMLKEEINRLRSITRWEHFKLIFKKKISL